MSPPRNWIMPSIYFKLAYTANTRRYHVDRNWKLDDFWNIMKSRIIRDFEIEEFEIVEAGQNVHNGIAEQGIAFNKNEDIRLCEKYGPNVNVSFYIRHISIGQEIRESANETNQTRIDECVVCYEDISYNYINRYSCNHLICSSCYAECIRHSLNTCPMCRRH